MTPLHDVPDGLGSSRYPTDPWRLVEREYCGDDLGTTETIFAVGNGYIGMRANPSEGREAHAHGTFLNGFHETWQIHHAEDAFGFAKTGQTLVNVPDAKLIKLYVDDEPLLLATAEIEHYERVLDFRRGITWREVVWLTPAGKRIRVRSERMVSFEHRHLALLTFEVELLNDRAPMVVSSQLLNRQDGEDEYHVRSAALGEGVDPRQATPFNDRVLIPRLQLHREDDTDGGEVILGYRCANSAMTLACGYRHVVETNCEYTVDTSVGADLAKTVFTVEACAGQSFRLSKFVTYHSSTGVPARELADRCHRTLVRGRAEGRSKLYRVQSEWLDRYWEATDVEIDGDDAVQQAVRWNLYQLAQASARTHEQGISAKGVTGIGYDGHYFWDTEVYVVPFLAYTNPEIARKLLRFRWRLLPAARERAAELNEHGALYPWRTINGEEASAYYAAGTAQYHINAAVAYALERYLFATGDTEFLAAEGAEILVETARLWADLGFYRSQTSLVDTPGVETEPTFHIHGVTGPDEYTTVVNDNLYTNVMARFNLRYAALTVSFLAEWNPDAYQALCRRTGLVDDEIRAWHAAADAMHIPFDTALGIHPQDHSFLEREPWDFEHTPQDKYPLLLHFHPLVIYRHQVLKQADVVLAMYLRTEHFDLEQKRRNFDYYDPITTGDSSLSAGAQCLLAAEIGYEDLAMQYFRQALYVDLNDTHGNTDQGVHIASAATVWTALVCGFAGMRDTGEELRFSPRLPHGWNSMAFSIKRHGSELRVEVDPEGCTVTTVHGPVVAIGTADGCIELEAGGSVRIERPT
jgi:alpha,alpha-trehalose phosphorylase